MESRLDYVKARFSHGTVIVLDTDPPMQNVVIRWEPDKGEPHAWYREELLYYNKHYYPYPPVYYDSHAEISIPIFNTDEWLAILQIMNMFPKIRKETKNEQ